jgi:hypothetical protein
MIEIQLDTGQLNRLAKATARAGRKFPRELAAAINATAKKTRRNIGREIRKTINLKKEAAERPIKLRKTATAQNAVAVVGIDREQRLGLQHFAARQNGKGVSYKISKQGGRKTAKSAFMGPRPGVLAPRLNGGVFARLGESRLPIVRLKGVSPYGAYAKNDMSEQEVKAINADLQTQIERRIKLNILRAEGLVTR